MPEAKLPPHYTRRVSLTKTQLRSTLGAELLSLCQTVTADGRLSEQELQDLRVWLEDSREADLPAISFLRETVQRILADGAVTPGELQELYRAIETVLPPELRRQAKAARKAVESQERAKNRPIASANFMVAGCRYEGRPEVIRRYAFAGDSVILQRDPHNPHSPNAIRVCLTNGRQIGFVPEDDARGLSPLLDRGARYKAFLTKILTGGRSPIPVVQAYLYDAEATVEGALATSPAPPDPPASAGPTTFSNSPTHQFKSWRLRLAIALIVVVLLVLAVQPA